MHTTQMEKFAEAEAAAAERPQANGSSGDDQPSGGSLASDAQLAALREKLAGSA
jgi:small subunit ribosomal protein S1